MECKFIKEWNVCVPIRWQAKNRFLLNRVIRKFNDWQLDGFKKDEANEVLRHIEYANQMLGKACGDYSEDIKTMRLFVESFIRKIKLGG